MKHRGFSLVELLVVVIIVAVIAAIAIPSLLASRRATNEASAIATVRNIHSAETAYFSVGGNRSFADLSELGDAGFLDPLIGGGDTTSKSGYTFNVSLPAASPFSVYCATAVADDFGVTGSRDFLVSSTGVVYETKVDGSMSCNNGVPNTAGGSPIQ